MVDYFFFAGFAAFLAGAGAGFFFAVVLRDDFTAFTIVFTTAFITFFMPVAGALGRFSTALEEAAFAAGGDCLGAADHLQP